MAIEYEQARRIAAERIGEGRPGPYGVTPLILEDSTRETEWGWVFFYNSREYVETGDFRQCLAGNAPVFVSKRDGTVYATGTARPIDEYIEEIEVKERGR